MEKYQNPSLSPAVRAQDLLSKMTLEEKIEQMNIIRGVWFANKPHKQHACSVEYDSDYKLDEIKTIFKDRAVGCVHDTYSNPKTLNTLQRYFVEQTRLGIPAIFTGEALHGLGAIGTSNFPTPICMGATFDEAVVEEVGDCIARETRSLGIHEILAPNLDVARDPRWGRTEETFGEDTFLSKKLAGAMVSGESKKGEISRSDAVICEPKHFVGHGSAEGGANCSHVRMGPRELYETCLPVFEAAFAAGAKNVMAAYHAIDGQPMCASPYYLTEILKEECHLPGYVRSDWGAVMKLQNIFHMVESPEDAVVTAVNAGLDLMGCFEYEAKDFCTMMVKAVQSGKIKESRIDDAVIRLLQIKFAAGLFEHPYTDEQAYKDIVTCARHDAVSLRAAEKGIVLLRNEGDLLPLRKEKCKKIALLGPFSKAPVTGGYSAIATRPIAGVLEELKKALGEDVEIIHENGCDIVPQKEYQFSQAEAHLVREKRQRIDADLNRAVEAAAGCDVAVIIGGDTAEICGEGIDRSTLSLYGEQPELIRRVVATGTPVVLVLLNGRPAVLAEESRLCQSILCCWHGGDFASQAVAGALVGKFSPAGRLPVSFPAGEGRVPCYYSILPGGAPNGYLEGPKTPLYPFGFGLSYTQFAYEDLHLEQFSRYEFEATVRVKNVGKVASDEVVQLYLTDPVSTVATPPVRLIGFVRTFLEAGEEKEVSMRFGFEELKMYMPDGKFQVEAGRYIISAAAASNDLRLSTEITVD